MSTPQLLCILVTDLNAFIWQQAQRYANVATQVVLICDHAPPQSYMQQAQKGTNVRVYHVSDTTCQRAGFYGMHPRVRVTAWDKVMYYLAQEAPGQAVWCLEYDVYVHDLDALSQLEHKAQLQRYDVMLPAIPGPVYGAKHVKKPIWAYAERARWPWWSVGTPWLARDRKRLFRAHSMIARFSGAFVAHCLAWRQRHKRFAFHEILFATLAKRGNMRCGTLPTTHVRWRPVYDWHEIAKLPHQGIDGIFHPVKRTTAVAPAVPHPSYP